MLKNIKNFSLVLVSALLLVMMGCTKSATSTHPRIYSTDAERAAFTHSLESVKWKSELVDRKKANVDKYIALCDEDPEWLVSRLQMNWKTKHSDVFLHGGDFAYSSGTAPVPTVRFSGTRDWASDYAMPSLEDITPYFDDERGMYLKHKKTGVKEWVHPSQVGHGIEGVNRRILSLVEDAALLYWITGEEKYAEFAAPVFFTYIDGMYYRNAPVDLDNSNQQRISGLATFEVIHEQAVVHLSVAYDFLYNYFNAQGKDLDHTVAVFQKWADQIIHNGIPDNNWNLFQARFLTYIALALDDDANYENGKGQQYYLDQVFNISTERQIALSESMLIYDQKTGIWPESPTYSMHVTTSFLETLTLLDNVTNADELKQYPIIDKAALASFQYLFPTGYCIGFGDSKHTLINTENFELILSNYKKYAKEGEHEIASVLKNIIDKGAYTRKCDNIFQLFFYADDLGVTSTSSWDDLYKKFTTPTFYAPNASWFVQRLGEGDNTTMIATVGSFGNHAHANGIAMELYANGYALGPEMGKGPSYWHPDHLRYYNQPEAHNTVVVDGISTYESMRSHHPFTLDNHFPAIQQPNDVFDEVSFSKVSFVEPKTMSDQQRLTAIINTESGSNYILDVFRSKKKEEGKQKHEYFYHNLGQSLELYDNDEKSLDLSATTELSTKKGDAKAYDYLSDKSSVRYSDDVTAIFSLQGEGIPEHLMKLWIKGDKGQEFFSVKSPKSNAINKVTAPKEMIGKELPTLIIRRNEQAWDKPFALVYNPYIKGNDKVLSDVEFKDKIGSQIINVTHTDGVEDAIITNTNENDITQTEGTYLKGLMSIVRKNKGEMKFIFVSGASRFMIDGWEILTESGPATVSIEKRGNEYIIQNDVPVLIRVPKDGEKIFDTIQYFDDGECVLKKKGHVHRKDPNQINFNLKEANNKVIISGAEI